MKYQDRIIKLRTYIDEYKDKQITLSSEFKSKVLRRELSIDWFLDKLMKFENIEYVEEEEKNTEEDIAKFRIHFKKSNKYKWVLIWAIKKEYSIFVTGWKTTKHYKPRGTTKFKINMEEYLKNLEETEL